MTRSSRLLSVAAIAALAVAACGGSTATTSPSEAPSAPASEAPAPSEAPATEAPATASPAAEGPDLEGAAGALDAIKKYQIDLSISGMMPTAAGADAITMSGLVDQEADAYSFEMTGVAGLGTEGTAVKFVVIGDDAWINLGGDQYIKTPGGASQFDSMRTSLAPSALLGQFPTTGLELFTVGPEEKNGIATTHYHASAADTPALAPTIGADGVMDVWVAEDGGYMVSMVMDGEVPISGAVTPVSMSIDLSRINDETINIAEPN
jgi:hypothetical protein